LAALDGNWFFPLFSIPFWAVGMGMAAVAAHGAGSRTQLTAEGDRLTLRRKFLRWEQVLSGSVRDLDGVELRTAYSQNNRPVHTITLLVGTEAFKFGTMLSPSRKALAGGGARRLHSGSPRPLGRGNVQPSSKFKIQNSKFKIQNSKPRHPPIHPSTEP
jgi:hypothetical protein